MQITQGFPLGNTVNQKCWFAMRDLKRRNAKDPAYLMLKDKVTNLYTPMEKRVVVQNGKRMLIDVPFLSDLLFVKESRAVLDPIVEQTSTLQYRFARVGKPHVPIIISDEEMEQFIFVTQQSDHFKYYTMEEVSPAMYGRWIYIVGGVLDGCKGRLMTMRGSKKKRLIVDLGGLLAVGVEVEPEFIRFVE